MTQYYYEMDIPRLCTALAHWLSCVLYLRMLPPRWGGAKRIALYGGALAVFAAYLVVTDGNSGWLFNLFYAGAVALMLAFFGAASRGTFWQCGYFCAQAFLLAGLASALMWQLYVYFAPNYALLQQLWALCVFVAVVYAGVFGCMFLILKVNNSMEAINFDVTPRMFANTALMATAVYILSSISYSHIETPFSVYGIPENGSMETHIIRTVAYFGGVALLFAYHQQICDLFAQREADALRNMLQLQYETYKVRQESIDLVNRKYHDLKHQIALLRTQGGDERNQVLDRLEQEIRVYEAQNDSGNKVLNTILAGKALTCQAKGIQLTSVADGAALDFMDPMDISNLFGNALDNAIESTSAIADAQKRLIHLSIARQKAFVAIRVENCYEGELHFKNGLPVTTKSDDRYHGFGLKSIQATAQKYGGSVTVSTHENWFELRVLIPDPAKKY